MAYSLCIVDLDALNIREHNGFGCRKWKVILVYSNVGIGESGTIVLVKNLIRHF